MKRRRSPALRIITVVLLITVGIFFLLGNLEDRPVSNTASLTGENSAEEDTLIQKIQEAVSGEPQEVKELRRQQTADADEGHLEYYFGLLNENEQKAYREILEGIRGFHDKFYLSVSGNEETDRIYHAVLKDHPELFWVHNREKVYKTTYEGKDYCQFSPGYTYSEEERQQITQAMEKAYQEVLTQIPDEADDYQKVMVVYTYIIDNTDYVVSQDDQSIAGTFWKKQAVCAGYAGAVQYLLERLGVYCIYVEGDARNSTQGHAWNIVRLDGEYYYVDATNGDQPDFLEGDAVDLVEHKTTIYDYLCPFPVEYEENYTASEEFPVPVCTATDKNFYVLNGACFDSYDREHVMDLCRLRIDNDAAVVRFKFSNQEAYDAAYEDLIENNGIQDVARYYMSVHGLSEISYHYGVLDTMHTMYYMF
ncbi:transglutaminase domain-containing protein [Blautia luti]|uniref:transglutaminase domain-containing protein n=1 Tax=Blautia luti TaxID=89014 RepID=UPI0018A9C12D|nr:transglutaminase domain-containing protein [Blautia luti]